MTNNLNKTKIFNLKNLDSIYSRLLNQQIDSDKIKKFNSNTQIVQEKSLKSRVADIHKLNANLNTLTLPLGSTQGKGQGTVVTNKFNILDNKSNLANGEVKAKVLNNSISLTSTTKNNMLDDYISYKQSQRQRLETNIPFGPIGPTLNNKNSTKNPNGSDLNKLNDKLLSEKVEYNFGDIQKYLQTIYGLPLSLKGGGKELILSKDLVYNFNNSIKKFKLDSVLENSFYFKKCLIGTRVFEFRPNNITLQVSYFTSKEALINTVELLKIAYFNPKQLSKYVIIRQEYLKYLCAYISKKIQKPFKLNLIKLNNLKSDSVLSAKAIGIVVNKITYQFRPLVYKFLRTSRIINPKMIKNVFYIKNKRSLNKLSFCTGVNLKYGGRLRGQSLTNRFTTDIFQNGTLNRVSSDILTSSRFTSKNIRGAFSITVTMGTKFF